MNKPKQVPEERFRAMLDAICYWLGYQLQIGREQLIHEASLRYPIADSITAKGTNIRSVTLEKLHPFFIGKRIDLVIYDEQAQRFDKEADDNDIVEVFELKIANSNTGKPGNYESQRVFNDIARLAYYNLWGKKACYFLMCGTYIDFKTYFVGQKNNDEVERRGDGKVIVLPEQPKEKIKTEVPEGEEWAPEGLYKDWFSFKIGDEPKRILSDTTDLAWGLKPFQESYAVRHKKLHQYSDSINIQTTCMAITPVSESNKTHAAGIWKIEAVADEKR